MVLGGNATWKLSLFCLSAMAFGGCKSTLDQFVCSSDEDCNRENTTGQCEESKSCSFSDPECLSTRRYSSSSGENSNMCTSSEIDGGMADATSSDRDDGACPWDLGFTIANIGDCGPVGNAPIGDADPLVLSISGEYSLDTTTGSLRSPNDDFVAIRSEVILQSNNTHLFVVVTRSFTLAETSSLRVRGNRSLVILALGEIRIEGVLNGSAKGDVGGPGAPRLDCSVDGDGEMGIITYGGGGGGFETSGGNGGKGDGKNTTADQAMGGRPELAAAGPEGLIPLRSGCGGGNGGVGNGGLALGGVGGAPGGAIHLASKDKVVLSGTIALGGGGGLAGRSSLLGGGGGGGGGGGSGGALLIQSPEIEIGPDSQIIVVGGGGGGGGGFSFSGIPGVDGNASQSPGKPGEGATSGSSSDYAGDGGGGANTDESDNSVFAAGDGQDARFVSKTTIGSAGGGGGGGGLGRVILDVVE